MIMAKPSEKSRKEISLKEHLPCSSISTFKMNYKFYYFHENNPTEILNVLYKNELHQIQQRI